MGTSKASSPGRPQLALPDPFLLIFVGLAATETFTHSSVTRQKEEWTAWPNVVQTSRSVHVFLRVAFFPEVKLLSAFQVDAEETQLNFFLVYNSSAQRIIAP